MALPIVQPSGGTPTSRDFVSLQTLWSKLLNSILGLPFSEGSILKNVSLISGTNAINHLLGRRLQGYCIVRQRAAATIFDQQDSNAKPEQTLNLHSSASVSVDIFVF